MTKKPLGCLTGSGLVATVLALAGVTIAALASDNGIFSPGALSAQASEAVLGGVNSHADLEDNCAACHAAFWGGESMEDRCLACHASIALERAQPATLHGSFGPEQSCRVCHIEHRGQQASLTAIEGITFAHDGVGFSLRAHRRLLGVEPFDCHVCHVETLRSFNTDQCRACHLGEDGPSLIEHIQTFGPGCLGCHDGEDRYGRGVFDHQQTAFALQGEHAGLACSQCHLNAHALALLRATPQGCVDCHAEADIHAGRLGLRCEECHSPTGWAGATIDHDRTGYPLIGAHAAAACESCHIEQQWTGLGTTCYACHAADDDHDGRYGQQCEACHQPTVWTDATFDHSLSQFPLTGAHVNTPCESCHTGGTFAGLAAFCAACHVDPAFHAGLFSSNCASCHNTNRWRPTPYNDPHPFPYNHGGAGGTCDTCHPDTLTRYSCFGCHEHNQSEVTKEHREEGIGDLSNCLRCHPTGREEEGDDD